MFCVVDSSKHETSVISYHLVRWGGGGGGGRFGWDTWFSGETEGVGGSVFANRVLGGTIENWLPYQWTANVEGDLKIVTQPYGGIG